jgi:phosphoribosylanthranilate isomerase
MPRTRVKLCGMMRPEDAVEAARLGADAVGIIVHANAKRRVEPDVARDIATALPPFCTPVGVFVDATVQETLLATQFVGLRHVQLHGRETPETVASLRSLRVIKAVPVDAEIESTLRLWRDAIARLRLTNLAGLLLEAPGTTGGGGKPNDFAAIARLQRDGHFVGLPPVIVAGGLKPENVHQVVRDLRPFAVDTSSGIESEFGRKDAALMQAFIAAVARGDQG